MTSMKKGFMKKQEGHKNRKLNKSLKCLQFRVRSTPSDNLGLKCDSLESSL